MSSSPGLVSARHAGKPRFKSRLLLVTFADLVHKKIVKIACSSMKETKHTVRLSVTDVEKLPGC